MPLQGMRRTIARRMLHNYQSVPHINFTLDADMTRTLALQEALQKSLGRRVSVTAILVNAVAWTLQRHPALNVHVGDEHVQPFADANIGVAVALEEGLIVPVVHAAQGLGIGAIAAAVDDLAERARAGRLAPDDVSGGTFTISNLGMFGVDHFTAIINAPEAAILAVGRIAGRFVPDDAGLPVARPMMTLTLAVDHRAVDGAQAARFLADLKRALEEPYLLLA